MWFECACVLREWALSAVGVAAASVMRVARRARRRQRGRAIDGIELVMLAFVRL